MYTEWVPLLIARLSYENKQGGFPSRKFDKCEAFDSSGGMAQKVRNKFAVKSCTTSVARGGLKMTAGRRFQKFSMYKSFYSIFHDSNYNKENT